MNGSRFNLLRTANRNGLSNSKLPFPAIACQGKNDLPAIFPFEILATETPLALAILNPAFCGWAMVYQSPRQAVFSRQSRREENYHGRFSKS